MRGAGVRSNLSKYPRWMSVTITMPDTLATPATACTIATGTWKPV